MGTLVEKFSNCWNYFWSLSGFPDLSGEVILITLSSPYLIIQQCLAIAM